jgi:uncharacterized membrane protein
MQIRSLFSSNRAGQVCGGVIIALLSTALAQPVNAAPGTQVYHIPSLLPGNVGPSTASGISADGSTVIGSCFSPGAPDGAEAYRWTVAGGTEGLGDLPGSRFNSFATGCSADGSVITGEGTPASGVSAFRWTRATGMTALPGVGSFDRGGLGFAVSAGGTVIVGNISGPETEPCRWTPTGAQILGHLGAGQTFAEARACSADGSVVAGYDGAGSGSHAFRWSEQDGLQALPDIPGGRGFTQAIGMSADGHTIAGISWGGSGADPLPVRWRDGVPTFIGRDANGLSHVGLAGEMTADGSVIIGNTPGGGVFVWDEAHLYRDLNEVLIEQYGIFEEFKTVAGISDDGRVIAGTDFANKGLVVVLPEPTSACAGAALLCAGLARRRASHRLAPTAGEGRANAAMNGLQD